jgi:hypothetical protein
MKKLVFNLLFMTVVLFAAVSSATACDCFLSVNGLTDEKAKTLVKKQFDQSLAVFTGEVIEINTFKVKFKVEKVWKGAIGDEIVMSTGTKDLGDGKTRHSSCDFNFEKGKKYIVFGVGKDYEEMQAFECSLTNLIERGAQQVERLDGITPHEKKNLEVKKN